MTLATNKGLRLKDDVTGIATPTFSRWKIEKYFRRNRKIFRFEDFRARKLAGLDALNFDIPLRLAFLPRFSMKPGTYALKLTLIERANPIRRKAPFFY